MPPPAADALSPILPANLEQVLQTTYSLFDFGQTLLVPVGGDKKIIDEQRGAFTLPQSRQADHLWLLACYDIAVACGRRGGNLTCIRFRAEADRTDFVANNPALAGTLLTSSPEGFFAWLRIEGYCPASHPHALCDWVSDGNVVVATRERESKHRFDNDGHPRVVQFKQIIWPGVLAGQWAFRLAKMEYEIVIADEKGKPMLNPPFVCSVFMNVHANIHFNPVTDNFYEQMVDARTRTVYDEEIKRSFHSVLSLINQCANKPDAPASLYVDMGLKPLAALVEFLKIFAVRPAEVEATPTVAPKIDDVATDAFEEFVQTQLEEERGASLTVEEALSAYGEYCATAGHPKLMPRQFRQRLPGAVRNAYDVPFNHDTVRDGRAKRGFRNLRLKSAILPDDRTAGTERTDLFEGLECCRSDLTTYLAVSV